MRSAICDSVAQSLTDELDMILRGLFRRHRWPTVERELEDIRQDCLLSLLQRLAASDEDSGCSDLADRERMTAWLYQALNNRLQQRRKAATREKRHQCGYDPPVDPDVETIDRALDNEELIKLLLVALRPWEKCVMALRYGLAKPHGFAYFKDEVARILHFRFERVASCEAYSLAKLRARSKRLGLDWDPR